MFRRLVPCAAVVLAVSCASPQVVREGPGWRELKVSDTQTKVELTSEDPAVLASVARGHPDPAIRRAAVDKIQDPAVLAEVARQDADAGVRGRAVARVVDTRVLAEIAKNDKDPAVQAVAAERRDLLRFVGPKHPEFAAWATLSPGTWVKFKAELRVSGDATTIDVLRTLTKVGPEGAVLEQRNAATGKAVQGAVKTMLDRAEAPAGRRVEGEESIDVRGRRVECLTSLVSGQFGGTIARVKTWRAAEVPGGIARLDVEESPQGEPLRYLRAWAVQWGP
ncbi:MAG TPA: hypothetical protein VF950_07610 [Planctomycetota bacterium]